MKKIVCMCMSVSERDFVRERERLCAKEYEGASTLSITTFSITTLSIMTFRITTLRITISKMRHST